MMDFYDYLNKNNLQGFLSSVDFTIPQFSHLPDVRQVIVNGIKDEKRFYIYGDYDVDGLMCIRSLVSIFDKLEYENYSVFEYRKRTHQLDKIAPHKCLQSGADIFIIADTGSSAADKGALDSLVAAGVEVVVLDHHDSDFKYADYDRDGIHIINTILENELGADYDLSAGALSFCVAAAVLQEFGIAYEDLSCYALTSLYSDCMNMGNELNRAIYHLAKRQKVPTDLLYFMNSYNKFNSRYIEYWFSPRVNALFRSENLYVINKLFINRPDNPTVLSSTLELADSIYLSVRELVASVCDVLSIEQYDNFVVADLGSVDENYSVLKNKLWNYTGLVASKQSDRYQKAAIVYCTNGEYYNGSFRDVFSREYLHVFKSFCNAGGHGAAFGLTMEFQELPGFLQWVSTLDNVSKNLVAGNQPVIIDYVLNDPDIPLIQDMATYNEFAGKGVPLVFIRKQVIGSMRTSNTRYGAKSFWGTIRISGNEPLPFGETVLFKPFWASNLKLERK